jgi:hypothetical protein
MDEDITPASTQSAVLPEVEMYAYLVVLLYLTDKKEYVQASVAHRAPSNFLCSALNVFVTGDGGRHSCTAEAGGIQPQNARSDRRPRVLLLLMEPRVHKHAAGHQGVSHYTAMPVQAPAPRAHCVAWPTHPAPVHQLRRRMWFFLPVACRAYSCI